MNILRILWNSLGICVYLYLIGIIIFSDNLSSTAIKMIILCLIGTLIIHDVEITLIHNII